MKMKVNGTRPSKIHVKGTIQLFWNLRDIFMKIMVKGTRPSKIIVEGTIQLFWTLKGQFYENQG